MSAEVCGSPPKWLLLGAEAVKAAVESSGVYVRMGATTTRIVKCSPHVHGGGMTVWRTKALPSCMPYCTSILCYSE